MPINILRKLSIKTDLPADLVLWRYIDTAKFMDLVHNQVMTFSRGDQFEDKFEGAFTKTIKERIEESYKEKKIEFSYEEFKRRLRERVFLSCWRGSPDDSMAMWSMYGRSKTAVAVTTTVGQLREALAVSNLPYKISIKKVEYVKHWRDPNLNIDPYSNVFTYKVKAYDFEEEVRVIIDRFREEFETEVVDTGLRVKISLDKVLRSIVVGPDAPDWFLELIQGIAAKYSIKAPVKESMLTCEPI